MNFRYHAMGGGMFVSHIFVVWVGGASDHDFEVLVERCRKNRGDDEGGLSHFGKYILSSTTEL